LERVVESPAAAAAAAAAAVGGWGMLVYALGWILVSQF